MEAASEEPQRHADLGELIDIWTSYRAMLERPRDPDVSEEEK